MRVLASSRGQSSNDRADWLFVWASIVTRVRTDFVTRQGADVQARRPATHVSLSRVGVTDVEKVIRIRSNGAEQLFYAQLECFVDLGPAQKGAHMSRFEEVVNEAIDEVVLGEAFKAETLAQHIAERVRDRQGALRAEVSIEARYPELKRAPASGSATQEIYTLMGSAVASPHGTRRLVGVEAQGMTACPCAQELLEGRARERLDEDGFGEDEIDRILASVPVATHNQRGIGRLQVGCPEACEENLEAATLLDIVESSMSSEIYELMKRSDEAEVVEKAHRNPRFVEDCVREMVRRAVDEFSGLGRARSSSPARRTWRPSTSTAWWPSATGCLTRSRPSWPVNPALRTT